MFQFREDAVLVVLGYQDHYGDRHVAHHGQAYLEPEYGPRIARNQPLDQEADAGKGTAGELMQDCFVVSFANLATSFRAAAIACRVACHDPVILPNTIRGAPFSLQSNHSGVQIQHCLKSRPQWTAWTLDGFKAPVVVGQPHHKSPSRTNRV